MKVLVEARFIEKRRVKGVRRGVKEREMPKTVGRLLREGAWRNDNRRRGGPRLVRIRESPKTRSLSMEERSMMPIVWMTTKSVAADFKAMKRTESKQRQEEENQVENREHALDGSEERWSMLTKNRFAE
jgi:hypothetical protein